MAIPPHLVREGDEWRLDVSVRDSRDRLRLSDRAENLLTERLDYGHRDVVPFDLAKALVLAGGASRPEDDERDLAWRLTGAEGGRELTDPTRAALADYLGSVMVPDDTVDTLREHVRDCGVNAHLDGDLRTRGDRVSGLSDIARDL